MRIKLTVQYDGTDFFGWQVQPNKKTIQGELQSALFSLTGENCCVVGSGRTDAGVHAFAQVAHFDISKDLAAAKFITGLNFYLPPSIRIIDAVEVSEEFHARFSAKKKTYIYRMYRSKIPSAIYRNLALNIPPEIDISAMNDAAKLLIGKKDFRSFMASGSDVTCTEREIYSAEVAPFGDFIEFSVCADGFLYNMVRIITAMLIKVGMGRLSLADVEDIINARDRKFAKFLAPACGLYLRSVEYIV